MRELARPGPEDQRRRLAGRHRAVEAGELLLRRRGERVRRLRLLQERQQPLRRERQLVGLHRTQAREVVLGLGIEHLRDALHAIRQRPFARDEVRVVGRMDALVGRAYPAARRIELARRQRRLEIAGPVVARVPAG